jgi:hypothetical protein
MKTFRGTNTRTPRAEDYEVPKGKSETIQDDSYTVKDIIQKHLQGIPVGEMQGDWGDDNDDFNSPDLEELQRADIQDKFRVHEEHLEKVKRAKEAMARPRKKEEEKNPPE